MSTPTGAAPPRRATRAVGGSTATPDQDVIDELGAALGVPQEPDAEVITAKG